MMVLATAKRPPTSESNIFECEKHPVSKPNWRKLARNEKYEKLTMSFSAYLVRL